MGAFNVRLLLNADDAVLSQTIYIYYKSFNVTETASTELMWIKRK